MPVPNPIGSKEVLTQKQGQVELTSSRNLNSKYFLVGFDTQGNMEYRFEAHTGHVHYNNKLGVGDGQKRYREIDHTLSWDNVRRGWSFQFHSFQPFIPEFADGAVEFRDLFEGKDQSVIFTAQCEHVKGEIILASELKQNGLSGLTSYNCIIYRDAFGEGKDYILYFTRSALCKVVRIRDGYKGKSDMEFDFQLELPIGVKVCNGGAEIMTTKDWTIKSQGPTLIGSERGDGREWNTYLRPFQVWDSGSGAERKKQIIAVKFYRKDGNRFFKKIIPAAFLETSTGDVFTDTTTSYYAGAGDGYIYSLSNISWANARQSGGGNLGLSVDYTATEANLRNDYFAAVPYYYIMRTYTPVDTSGLTSSATITAADLVVKGGSSEVTITHTTHVVQTGQTSLSTLDSSMFPPPAYTSAANKTAGAWTVGGTNTFTLDATGRGWISKTGNTYIGLIGDPDQSNTTPAGYNAGACPKIETSESSNDPYLSITYTLPATGHTKNLLLLGVG